MDGTIKRYFDHGSQHNPQSNVITMPIDGCITADKLAMLIQLLNQ